MDSLDDRHTKLTTERDQLMASLETGSRLNDETLAHAMQFRADVIGGQVGPTFDGKRLCLELLQVTVAIRNGRATIRSQFKKLLREELKALHPLPGAPAGLTSVLTML
jgi:flagellar motor protein MotB